MNTDSTGTLFLPPQSSTISGQVDSIFNFLFITSIVFFLIVVSVAVFFVIRYRKKAETTVQEAPTYNLKLEILWTAIPTILVFVAFFLGFRAFIKMHIVPKDALQVKVTSQKWFWTFDYPDVGVNSVNELVVPVGKPVQLTMSSKDVIHSFYVPGFRIKMDVLPNRYTVTWFEASRTGEFQLFCAEYCGTGHSEMIGKVKVLSEREYNDWLQAGSGGGGEGISLVDLGAKLYRAKACVSCHSIDGTPGIAPSFKGRFGTQIQLEGGKQILADENYLRESMLDPTAKVALGFQPVMPSYQGILKDKDIDALVAFIKSLQKQK
jgi:cytochrome c oxidase subunit 2